jgi:tRNA-dihydrouridine synthase
MKDIIPLITWAKANGEAKIVDRIFVKLLPELLQANQLITTEMIETESVIHVPEALYQRIQSVAESLVGQQYH